MTEKEKQKAESRLRILDAAATLFRTQGFTATGVDQLMEEAGLTAGAFYAHFKSKQELFDRTLEHMMRSSAGHLTQGLDLEHGKNVVSEMLARYVTEEHRDHEGFGCAVPAIAEEIRRHSRNGTAILGGYIDRWANLFARHLEGTPRERRAEAIRLISQAIGAVLLSRLVPEKLSQEVLAAGSTRAPRIR